VIWVSVWVHTVVCSMVGVSSEVGSGVVVVGCTASSDLVGSGSGALSSRACSSSVTGSDMVDDDDMSEVEEGISRGRDRRRSFCLLFWNQIWGVLGRGACHGDVECHGWIYLHFLLAQGDFAHNVETGGFVGLCVAQILCLEYLLVFFAVGGQRIAMRSWWGPVGNPKSSRAREHVPSRCEMLNTTNSAVGRMVQRSQIRTRCGGASGEQEVCCQRRAAVYLQPSRASAREMQSRWPRDSRACQSRATRRVKARKQTWRPTATTESEQEREFKIQSGIGIGPRRRGNG
jgi:hypothetical protein